jgi:hypothetical protein
MDGSMVKLLMPQECLDLIKGYVTSNFPDFELGESGSHTGWWWLNFCKKDVSVEMDFEGDYGGHFFVYIQVDGKKYELRQFDNSIDARSISNKENILFQLEIIKKLFEKG